MARQGSRLDCEGFRERLDDYAAGRLDAGARAGLDAHRAACAECAALVSGRARPPRLVAAGFLAAFAASVLTLIYTGLSVRGVESADEAESAAAAAGSERTRSAEREPSAAGGTGDERSDPAEPPAGEPAEAAAEGTQVDGGKPAAAPAQ